MPAQGGEGAPAGDGVGHRTGEGRRVADETEEVGL